MQRRYLWVAIAALAVFGFLLSRDVLGRLAWEKYRWPEAATVLNRRDAGLNVKIGHYYFGEGAYDLERAAKAYQRALAIDPRVPDAWHQLARIDFLRGDFHTALEKISRQIELHGDSLMASYYVRGLINGYAGNLEAAKADFKKFLAWDPTNWATHNDLAWIYFRRGAYAEVETMARLGLATNPANPWLLNSLGVALLNLGRRDEARQALLEAEAGASSLTLTDWQKAYPGNNPKLAGEGLKRMQGTVSANLRLLAP